MYRRKVMLTAAAVFAFGVAFAAQPISLRADWGEGGLRRGSPWVPGANMLMSAHESNLAALTPPQ
jgi:hypothetical protein